MKAKQQTTPLRCKIWIYSVVEDAGFKTDAHTPEKSWSSVDNFCCFLTENMAPTKCVMTIRKSDWMSSDQADLWAENRSDTAQLWLIWVSIMFRNLIWYNCHLNVKHRTEWKKKTNEWMCRENWIFALFCTCNSQFWYCFCSLDSWTITTSN